jgi:type II secretory pathway pseudopilin PulG
LIEIMLVVVIIGVLSTFALPYFQNITARARRAEANIVLDKIHVYFMNQYETSGTFYTTDVANMYGGATSGILTSACNPDPATATGQAANWIASRSGWQQIPFAFDGGLKLRYGYAISDANDVTITVVGQMPGLGAATTLTVGGSSVSGNYQYTEIMTGTPGGGVFINPSTVHEFPMTL